MSLLLVYAFRGERGTTSFPLAIHYTKLCFMTGPPDNLIYSVDILSSSEPL